MRHLLVLPFILGPALPVLAQLSAPQNPAEISDLDNLATEDLVDAPLMGASGDRIGTIENVLVLDGDTDKVVVGTGGYGDLSTRKVLFELSDIRIDTAEDGTIRATTPLTRAESEALSTYQST